MKPVIAAAAAASLLVPVALKASENASPQPITIGEAYVMETQGAERRINVVLPRDYEESSDTYPLIIMLDAGLDQDFFLALGLERWNQLWGRSQPAIFVGIETVDRQRELLPPTSDAAEAERYPTAGESANFRNWLSKEVLPMLRDRYRHDGRAFLFGESAAGHFVAETWVRYPGAFDGYAALSPSFQWNDQSLSREIDGEEMGDRPPLFLSIADEGGPTEEGAMRFVGAAPSQLCFADRRKSHVHHSNSLQQLLPQALQYLLPTKADWLEEYGLTVGCKNKEEEPK